VGFCVSRRLPKMGWGVARTQSCRNMQADPRPEFRLAPSRLRDGGAESWNAAVVRRRRAACHNGPRARSSQHFPLLHAFRGVGRPDTIIYRRLALARDFWLTLSRMLPITGVMNSLPRRRGRPPGMSPARLKKRSIIAAAVLAGAKLAVFARQSRVSRSWASREAHAPGTRQLLQKLASDPELIESLLHKSTTGILKRAPSRETAPTCWTDHHSRA
jgi:hypothetical protein